MTNELKETPALPEPASRSRIPVQMGIAPRSLEEGWRLANLLAPSELVPKNFRGKPADILVALQWGIEIGLPPMAALSSIYVVNGRPALWGDGLLAVVVASSHFKNYDEWFEVDGNRCASLHPDDLKKDTTTAVCAFTRHGKATPVVARFSIAQAKKANLWGKDTWNTFPDRMLRMRARTFAARDCFPDVLRGIHTDDEVRDLPPDSDDAAPLVHDVRRLSELQPAAAAPPPPPAAADVLLTATVVNVEAFMGQYVATLSDGAKVEIADDADAVEIEKFKGTDHALRIVCERRESALHLKSFAIAE